MGRDNLDALLVQQKCMLDRAGLGYTFDKNQNLYKNFFNFLRI